jgi:hypothetical protein
MESEGA